MGLFNSIRLKGDYRCLICGRPMSKNTGIGPVCFRKTHPQKNSKNKKILHKNMFALESQSVSKK